jgi:hypothetical protein
VAIVAKPNGWGRAQQREGMATGIELRTHALLLMRISKFLHALKALFWLFGQGSEG